MSIFGIKGAFFSTTTRRISANFFFRIWRKHLFITTCIEKQCTRPLRIGFTTVDFQIILALKLQLLQSRYFLKHKMFNNCNRKKLKLNWTTRKGARNFEMTRAQLTIDSYKKDSMIELSKLINSIIFLEHNWKLIKILLQSEHWKHSLNIMYPQIIVSLQR